MSSAADTLRRAAEVLRERAEAATPGPWFSIAETPYYQPSVGTRDTLEPEALDAEEWVAECGPAAYSGSDNATYIATVDPTVGLALADWLDDMARLHEHGDSGGPLIQHHALTIARAILKEQP